MLKLFTDRTQAGQKLATAIKNLSPNGIVLAVPRGGVVVGYEIAKAYGLQLDIYITKKIGAPGNPELAIGAIAEDGTYLLDDSIVAMLNVPPSYITAEAERQKGEIKRRLQNYRGNAPALEVTGREVVLVDDGVATGSTLKAALRSLRKKGVKPLIVAVPVGPRDTINELKSEADLVVCPYTPEPFYAIGEFYEDFEQTPDEQVTTLLQRNKKESKRKEVTA